MLSIVLADPDEAYIDMLGTYIGAKCGSKAEVAVFTRLENLREHMDKCGKVDILLTAPEFNINVLPLEKAGMKFLLIDRQPEVESEFQIFKYKPAQTLLEEVLSKFAETGTKALGNMLKGDRTTRLITVHSARGDSGKTLAALALSIQLAKQGCKILYFNFETISSLHYYLSDRVNNPNSMTSLLYFLRKETCKLPLKLDMAFSHDVGLNISYMDNPGCAFDLCELTTGDMNNLLNQLRGMGRFDAVILEGDSGLSEVIVSVLSHSDAIVYIYSDSPLSEYKQMLFERELTKHPGLQAEALKEKLVYIVNKYKNEKRQNIGQLPGDTFKVPVYNDIFSYPSKLIQINLDSSFIKAFEAPVSAIMKKAGIP